MGCILVMAIAVQCLDLSVVQTVRIIFSMQLFTAEDNYEHSDSSLSVHICLSFPCFKLCGAIVTIALLYVGYLSFATRSNEEKQNAFNLIICVISVVSASWFLMTVIMIYRGKIDEDKPAHTADRVVLWRIAGGGIPPLTILFTFIPLVATPAGFDIQLAKKVSAITMAMFTVSAYFVANSPCPGHCTAQDKEDRQVATKIDFFFGILFYSMCLFSCVPGAQVGVEFISLLRNSQTGDSILNHILKNAISEAACLLEIEISAGGDKVDADPNITPEVHSDSNVALALKQLYRTMEWCASRQTYLNLAEGTYRSNLVSVDLKTFLFNLTKGSVPFSIEDHTDACLARNRSTIAFDEKMAHLALENAVRNATTHGDGSMVQLSATFCELTPPSNSPGTVNGELVFSVSNRIPPDARVSTQVLKKISKRDKMSSTIILASEASRPIEAGAHNLEHQSARVPVKHFGSISTNSGLIHIGIAMEGAGGSYDIRTTPNSDGTSNFVIDIMLPAYMNQNRGGHNSFSETGPSLVAQPESPYSAQTKVVVPPEGGTATFGPKCCAIDDSSIICKGKPLFTYQLSCFMRKSPFFNGNIV